MIKAGLRLALLASTLIATASHAQVVAPPADQPEPLVRNAPANAPNVIVILLDDVGFAASSAFGGPVATPTLRSLSQEGLRYTRFHTTGICSPTRASLLTGRNPHATGIGAVMNTTDPRRGYTGFHGKDTASVATVLQQNGYSTAMFGKWHQVTDWEASPIGPFDRWPTGEGFDRFYGFIGGETNQFEPTLINGTTPVMRPPGKDYHLSEDLADQAVKWMNLQQSIAPERPYFLYFAPGAAHAPLQVPKEWADRYKGRFDSGWDKLREEIFRRQKQAGLIPRNARLTPRETGMPAWNSLTAQQRRFAARSMEVYAAFLEHVDTQVGKLVEAVDRSGEKGNTLIFYVFGDNGGSAEGGLLGSVNYFSEAHGAPESDEYRAKHVEAFGSQQGNNHYAAGWAWAMNTPFRWTKAVPSHLGATRNALVVRWPDRVAGAGTLRHQFGHVNDIAPTILQAAGITLPEQVNGIRQKPFDGSSMLESITTTKAPEYHRTQYFEVFGHRSIYHEGWMASAFHARLPWAMRMTSDKTFDADTWELFDLSSDATQAVDLSARYPAKLAELKALFDKEAERNHVLPLRNYSYAEGRKLPNLANGRTSITYHEGALGIPETSLPSTFSRSWQVAASIEAKQGANGVIAAVGGESAGWSLYLDAQGAPNFAYRRVSGDLLVLKADRPMPTGKNDVTVNFDYEGPGAGGAAKVSLVVNGSVAGEGRVQSSAPTLYTIDETFDVGIDRGSPVATYPESAGIGFAFTGGSIGGVTITAK